MIFHSFAFKDERRSFGGSAFIELQFCKLKKNTKDKKIISLNKMQYWLDDSLFIYVDDIEVFMDNYESVFSDRLYNNLSHGPIDIYGINYYSPAQVNDIIYKIEKLKPSDHLIILEWLKKAKKFNGIYIIGI